MSAVASSNDVSEVGGLPVRLGCLSCTLTGCFHTNTPRDLRVIGPLRMDVGTRCEQAPNYSCVTEGEAAFCSQVGLKEAEDILRDVDLNGDGLVDFEGKTRPSSSRRAVPLLQCVTPLLSFSAEFVRMMSR